MKLRSLLVALLVSASTAAQAGKGSHLLDLAGNKVDTGRTVILSQDVSCSPLRSFELWSTKDGVKSFFAPDARIGEALGGDYNVIFFPAEDPSGTRHGTAGARVLARDPGRFLAFEWVVFAGDDTKGRNAPPFAPESLRRPPVLPTWVELSFSGTGAGTAGTHVEFRHYGFQEGAQWNQSQAWFTRAWKGVLTQMKEYCDGKAIASTQSR